MNKITPETILAQMRQMSEAAQNNPIKSTQATPNADFTSAMSKAINTVNQYQSEASQAARSIESGDGGVSLVKAMIASQKSSVAFEAAVQVRNRVVSAYQDIMNMPI
ncbi:MAG: flagellar hook-basal body complex protein FliE [Gammaproteobacteria bacterium]|nr:flagellar hook-basal body complex protein FliE [Gammaproteobacteria bacterium]